MTAATTAAHPGVHYRPDIDGLRAVAVLAVLAFHAFPSALPGGFVGVDVFFVISGFLISGIILTGLQSGTFRFAGFYARRIRRIFPALAVVLAATLLAGWFLLLPQDYRQLGKHVAGGAGFISNFLLWSESGYFDQAAELKPLLHLWSLGIEEQFYLLWPLLLWMAWRRTGKQVRSLVLATFALSLAANLWLTRVDPTAAFYLPLTRFWELAAGALLASATPTVHAMLQRRVRAGIQLQTIASWSGAALLAGSVLWLDPEQPFPGWRALPPVLGSVLLIAAGPQGPVNRLLLSLRPMVWVGLISYPLYLWHWPVIAFQNIFAIEPPTATMRWAGLAGSFVLAALTYRFVEKPIRFGMPARAAVTRLAWTMAATSGVGLALVVSSGVASRFPGPMARYASYQYAFRADARAGTCWLDRQHAADAFSPECVDPPDAQRPLLVLWGDSHAARLFPGLRAVAGDEYRLAQFTRNSCPPAAASTWRNKNHYPTCRLGNAHVMRQIQALRPRTVVLFAYWHEQFTLKLLQRTLVPTIGELKRMGVAQVIVVGPAPKWRQSLPNMLVELYRAEGTPTPRRTRFGLVPTTAQIDARLRRVVEATGQAVYFSALSALCTQEGCLTYVGNDLDALTTWDYGHLTTPAATLLASELARATHNFDPGTSGGDNVGKTIE